MNAKPSSIKTQHGRMPITLEIQPDLFVSRAPKELLKKDGFKIVQMLSPHSFAVSVDRAKREAMIEKARDLGHHAYPFYLYRGTPFLASSRLIVRFREALDGMRDQLWAELRLSEVEKWSDLEFAVEIDRRQDPIRVAKELRKNAATLIDFVEHDLNHRLKPSHVTLPTHKRFLEQWHLHGNGISRRASIRCDEAWSALHGFGDENVVIGVTDDGCDLEHRAFAPREKKFPAWAYFTTEDFHSSEGDGDIREMRRGSIDHGTACAGLIAGRPVEDLPVGVAPNCRIIPVKFDRFFHGRLLISTSVYRRALKFLADKVDVICNPWGETPHSLWGTAMREEIARLAREGGRRGKGIVFVWAAGNRNAPLLYDPKIDRGGKRVEIPYTNGRSSFGEWIGVAKSDRFENDLVGLPGVVHVGAISSDARRSHFSNYGRGLTLCAPSNNLQIYGADASVRGRSVAGLAAKGVEVISGFGGTSTSAAVVAGVAALVISANPNLTAEQVVWILKTTADKSLDMTGYKRGANPGRTGGDGSFDISPIKPFDKGDFIDPKLHDDPDGCWSPWFGFGKVNAKRAVEKALELKKAAERNAAAPSLQSPVPVPPPAPQTPIASPPHPHNAGSAQSKPS